MTTDLTARTRVRRLVVALAAAALFAGTGIAANTPASAATAGRPQPRIGDTAAFDAPIGQRGGITNPTGTCPSWRVEPRFTWTLSNNRTSWSRTWRWTGALPGIAFPRVRVGGYTSTTTMKCRTTSFARTQQVRVGQKTRASTVSRGEWNQIRRGMTRAQVARIVGTDGRDRFRWDGKLSLTYDMMAFWRWSLVTYRHGRVVEKSWNVGHD